MAEEERAVAHLRQSIEGQLLKFTNVMKGFQPRWVVLDADRSVIEYYEKEEFRRLGQKARGTLHLFGAAIYPSDEDSQTFTIHSAGPGNELFRLKAVDAKERQRWIMHLRVISEYSQPHLLQLGADSSEGHASMSRSLSDSVTQHGAAQAQLTGSQPQHTAGIQHAAPNSGLYQTTQVHSGQSATTPTGLQHDHNALFGSEATEPPAITDISNGAVRKHLVELIERMNQECELTSAHICALPAPIGGTATAATNACGSSDAAADGPSLPATVMNPEGNGQQPSIETPARSIDCLDRDLLMMKATIRAAIASVKECLQLLDTRKAPSKPDVTSPHYLHAFRSRPRTATKQAQSPTSTSTLTHQAAARVGASALRDLQAPRVTITGKTRVVGYNTNSSADAPHTTGRGLSFDMSELDKTVEIACTQADPARSVSTCAIPIAIANATSLNDNVGGHVGALRSDSDAETTRSRMECAEATTLDPVIHSKSSNESDSIETTVNN